MLSLDKRRLALALLAAFVALGCAACGPEDGRGRGDGPGADIGNKAPTVVPQSKLFNEQSP
jgi:hypothetical protein